MSYRIPVPGFGTIRVPLVEVKKKKKKKSLKNSKEQVK